jgi:hypothetical protein
MALVVLKERRTASWSDRFMSGPKVQCIQKSIFMQGGRFHAGHDNHFDHCRCGLKLAAFIPGLSRVLGWG